MARLTTGTGAMPAIRWLAPVAAIGYLAVLSRGGSTVWDWVLAAASGLLALFGGRYPAANVYGQAALLATVQLLARTGTPAIKDSPGGLAASAGVISDSTAGPVQLMATLALVEFAVRVPLRRAAPAALVLAVVDIARWTTHQSVVDLVLPAYQLVFFVAGPLLLGTFIQQAIGRYRQIGRASCRERV